MLYRLASQATGYNDCATKEACSKAKTWAYDVFPARTFSSLFSSIPSSLLSCSPTRTIFMVVSPLRKCLLIPITQCTLLHSCLLVLLAMLTILVILLAMVTCNNGDTNYSAIRCGGLWSHACNEHVTELYRKQAVCVLSEVVCWARLCVYWVRLCVLSKAVLSEAVCIE